MIGLITIQLYLMIRIDTDTKKISVIDVLRKLLSFSIDDKERNFTNQQISKRIKYYSTKDNINIEYKFKINNRDALTCVGDLNTITNFINIFRCNVSENNKDLLIRELSDATRIPEIMIQNNDIEVENNDIEIENIETEIENNEVNDMEIVEDTSIDDIMQGIRVDTTTNQGSIIDVIKMIIPGIDSRHAGEVFTRLCTTYPEMVVQSDRIKINGIGHETPVADAKTLVEIVWLCPSRAAREFRRKSAQTICRVLAGDVSLINEIEQRHNQLNGSEEGKAIQDFLLSESKGQVQEIQQIPMELKMATSEQKKMYVDAWLDEKKRDMQMNMDKKRMEIELYQKEKQLSFIDRGYQLLERINPDLRDRIVHSDLVRNFIQNSIVSQNTYIPIQVQSEIIPEDDPSIPTHDSRCHPIHRGQEISLHTVASEMGVRIKYGNEGKIGKAMKRLYSERYGIEASRNIPKRNVPFNGQVFPANSYWFRDSDLMRNAIIEVNK